MPPSRDEPHPWAGRRGQRAPGRAPHQAEVQASGPRDCKYGGGGSRPAATGSSRLRTRVSHGSYIGIARSAPAHDPGSPANGGPGPPGPRPSGGMTGSADAAVGNVGTDRTNGNAATLCPAGTGRQLRMTGPGSEGTDLYPDLAAPIRSGRVAGREVHILDVERIECAVLCNAQWRVIAMSQRRAHRLVPPVRLFAGEVALSVPTAAIPHSAHPTGWVIALASVLGIDERPSRPAREAEKWAGASVLPAAAPTASANEHP
jgi:hypothetical protein